jgi:hypothetical protein
MTATVPRYSRREQAWKTDLRFTPLSEACLQSDEQREMALRNTSERLQAVLDGVAEAMASRSLPAMAEEDVASFLIAFGESIAQDISESLRES